LNLDLKIAANPSIADAAMAEFHEKFLKDVLPLLMEAVANIVVSNIESKMHSYQPSAEAIEAWPVLEDISAFISVLSSTVKVKSDKAGVYVVADPKEMLNQGMDPLWIARAEEGSSLTPAFYMWDSAAKLFASNPALANAILQESLEKIVMSKYVNEV